MKINLTLTFDLHLKVKSILSAQTLVVIVVKSL